MLRIRAAAVCNRCKVNMPISIVFSMVRCEKGQYLSISLGIGHRSYTIFSNENRRPSY